MSWQGILHKHGIETSRSYLLGRKFAKQGLVAVSPNTGPFKDAPHFIADPSLFATWEEDFFEFRIPYLVDAAHDTDHEDPLVLTFSTNFGWEVSAIGNGLTADPAIVNGVSGQGILSVVTAITAPGDGANIQWHTPCFRNLEDKNLFYTCRAKFVDTSVKVLGGIVDFSVNAFVGTPKGIYFTIGVANPGELICTCQDGTGGTSVTVADNLPNNTWGTISFRTDGDTAYFYASDVLVATIASHVPSDLPFAPTMGVISGAAAIQSVYVDYIKIIAER
jgi:hypothetical protein